jgi:cytochrome c-type biogenesis protein CcmH
MSGLRSFRLLAVLTLALSAPVLAIDITVMPTDELQARYEALTHELRCMQCQNNSIADSPADVASALRRDVQEQLLAGKTDDEIRASMIKRYGDVILFRPPLSASTAWVWIAPIVALLGGILVAVVVVRRRKALVASDDSVIEKEEAAR